MSHDETLRPSMTLTATTEPSADLVRLRAALKTAEAALASYEELVAPIRNEHEEVFDCLKRLVDAERVRHPQGEG